MDPIYTTQEKVKNGHDELLSFALKATWFSPHVSEAREGRIESK